MILDVLFLVVAIALLFRGGDLFVEASVRFAELLDVPRVVIGSTLVSLATTSPELVVSIIAGLEESPGLAVGNAVGSCICNLALVLGTMALMGVVPLHPRTLFVPVASMIALGSLLFLLTFDLEVSRAQGGFLIGLGVVYFVADFLRHRRARNLLEDLEARIVEQELLDEAAGESATVAAFRFAAGAALVLVGSRLLVDSAVGIATDVGVPSIVIGLTVVAFGTSLPELVTGITSARRGVSDLAVGNVLGANIANLTVIVGSAAALSPVTMSRTTQLFNFPALLVLCGLFAWMIHSGRDLDRREGLTLAIFYGGYVAILVTLVLLGREV